MDSEWLKPDVISSLLNTGTAGVLAGVALVFGYRQNVGWKPVVFGHNSVLTGMGGKHKHTMKMTIEFWNRRKYPLVLRSYEAEVLDVEILPYPAGVGKPYVRQNTVYYSSDAVVNPQERVNLQVEVEFENQSLDAMRPVFLFRVDYTDPYLKRRKTARGTNLFFYPELGWTKNEEQRQRAREAYAEILAADRAIAIDS